MARKKKSSSSSSKTPLWKIITLGVATLSVGYAGWTFFNPTPPELPPPPPVVSPAPDNGKSKPKPIPPSQKVIQELNKGSLKLAKAKEELTPSELLFWDKDLNADKVTDALVIHPAKVAPSSALKKEGYKKSISGLELYRLGAGGSERLLLQVTQKQMNDDLGARLIQQEEAKHGYAFKTSTYKDKSVYPSEVTLLHLILIDEQGNGKSDEITLYWKPSTKRFAATNTFGEPGSF